MSEVLLAEDRGGVRILTMNRPDKRNALDTALTQALLEAFEAADADGGVRAVVLTGAGKGFCAGADLGEFKDLTPDRAEAVSRRAELTCRCQMAMQRMAKPVVSAVHGAAVGGGAGLAIGADMMVAGEDLKFGYPELRHDIVPALVMTGLMRHVDRKTAFEMVSLGRLLTAGEACEMRIANRVVAPGEVVPAALEIAETWAGLNPAAIAEAKRLLYAVEDLPYEEAMEEGRAANERMRGFREAKA